MARIGLRYFRYCKVNVTENEDGTETETLGPGRALARAISANQTLNIAEATEYSNDGPTENAREFVGGTIELAVNDLTKEIESDILGHQVGEDGTLWNDVDDEAPYLRLGAIRTKILNGKRLFEPFCYMRVKFADGNENDQTKGASIELRSATITGSLLRNSAGKWRAKDTFETLAEANTWLDAMCNVTEQPGG